MISNTTLLNAMENAAREAECARNRVGSLDSLGLAKLIANHKGPFVRFLVRDVQHCFDFEYSFGPIENRIDTYVPTYVEFDQARKLLCERLSTTQ